MTMLAVSAAAAGQTTETLSSLLAPLGMCFHIPLSSSALLPSHQRTEISLYLQERL